MSRTIIFKGPFKNLIPQYIEYKRALGFDYSDDYVSRFKKMDDFFDEKYSFSEIKLTKDMVLDYVRKRNNETNSTITYRCSMIREFAIFFEKFRL